MTTTALPAYEPKAQPESCCGYDKRVKAYGDPPTGYRWLKVGEKMPAESIYACYHDKKWIKMGYVDDVKDSHYAFAAPITPELIPADPSAAVALEVVGRNSKAVRFKIARQAAEIKKTGELFTAKNKLVIVRHYYPEFRTDFAFSKGRLYLRGSETGKDDDILSCTPAQFKRIVAALTEYNASLTPKAETKIVPSPTVAELQSEIATLNAKVATLEKKIGGAKIVFGGES